MGKRKQNMPQKAGDEKRKSLTWNMMDSANTNTDDQLIDDTPDIHTSDVNTPDIHTTNVNPPNIHTTNVNPPDIHTTNVNSPNIYTTNVNPPDIHTTSVNPLDIYTTNVNMPVSEKLNSAVGSKKTDLVAHSEQSLDPVARVYRRDDLLLIYQRYLEFCLFSIPVLKEPKIKQDDWSCVLGEFEVKFSASPLFCPLPTNGLPDVKQFTLQISKDGEKDILSYETFTTLSTGKLITSGKDRGKIRYDQIRHVTFWLVDAELPFHCLESLKCKGLQPSIQVVVKEYDVDKMCAILKILGTEAMLSELGGPSDAVRATKLLNRSLQVLVEHFYGVLAPEYDDLPFTKKHDIDGLYSVIKGRRMADLRKALPGTQHPDLLPMLRPYQQQAISWMLEKEHTNSRNTPNSDGLHILYSEIVTYDGKTIYFNKYAGILIKRRPVCLRQGPGGILGDEMGLGKTVEVLACILLNPRDPVALPEPLPVLQDLIPEVNQILDAKLNKKKKRRTKKRKGTRQSSYSSDSDDTVIYSDKDQETGSSTTGTNDVQNQSKQDIEEHDKITTGKVDTFLSGCAGAAGDSNMETCINSMGHASSQSDNYSQDSENIGNGDNLIKTEQPYCLTKGSVDASGDAKSTQRKAFERGSKNKSTRKPEVHRFECLCGATSEGLRPRKSKHPVQCSVCHLWQHAECVNYDLTDPYRGEFKCPHCLVASEPISSGATLIISPFAIAHQWVEEILKHVKKEAISVFMYNGVHKQGFIQPWTLAKQNIVITTYETLRKEIDYVDLPHSNSSEGRRLRHAKRFMAIPSPITAVQWWRICLDEAQMVECTTTKTAEMALRLSAVNRWCVTGTPIQKSIDDVYGLLLFLGVDPYWVHMWWDELVFKPFCHGITGPMYDLLTSVMWRTVKDDVLDQINIPKQTDEIHWLTFSPVEEHFYRRQYKDCVRLSLERLSKWSDRSIRLSSLDRQTVSQLLYPLLRLRQACCHPQAVRGEFLPIQKSTMTMEELLESLTKKAKLEAEESHRAVVAAINGEAGLHIINDQYVEAVEKYREVLRSVEEHKDTLKTDSLQQLHAMYNLHQILVSKPAGIAPTLRDDQLPKQIDELRDRYMAKAVAYVKSTEEALTPARFDVQQTQREFAHCEEWWLDVVQWAIDRELDDKLVLKVRDDLLDNRSHNINSLIRSCRSAAGLEYAVQARLSGLDKAYHDVCSAMKGLEGKPSTDLINKTVECCLRPEGQILKNCPFCLSEELFEMYESQLFLFVEMVSDRRDHLGNEVSTQRQGTWADSEVEKALKSILSFAKHHKASDEMIESGTIHIKLLDAMKKEFKKLRSHWAGIKEHVAAFDELDMSTTRLRLRLPHEPPPVKSRKRLPHEPEPEAAQLNILEKSELTQHKMKLASDRIIAQGELRKKLGQYLYLTNLAKNQTNNKGGFNPDPCPICQQELGKEWSVMQCGHCFCIECIRILVERASFGRRNFSVQCAICRQMTHQGEISYVTTSPGLQLEDISVKGSHSTKVEAVVRCLLQIQRDDPKAKSLVFSTWTDVLSVIAKALDENNISYKALYTAGRFQENLTLFKETEDVSTLLLPVHSGANGLNLIEATYVLLVEPILNPAQELQAIGRVHRIGQTKSTHVHRFLIRNTIEQKMNVLLQSMDKHNLLEKSEESSLTIGDLSSLFAQQVEQEDRGVLSQEQEVQDNIVSLGTNTQGDGNNIVRPGTSSQEYMDLSDSVKPSTSSQE